LSAPVSPRIRRLLPSFIALQFFDAAARHLSFTKAASELCVTQSAISRQIRQMEDHIGRSLFHRSHGRLTLTSEGVEYAASVRALLQQAEATTMKLMGLGSSDRTLTIAILPTFGSRWLVPRLPKYLRDHTSLQLIVKTYFEPFCFESSDVDIAVHFGTDAWPAAVHHRFMDEVAVPVCSPSLIRGVDPGQRLMSLPLLQHTTRPVAWLQFFSQVGLPTANALSGPRFDHFYMMIQAAIAGLGIALLPRFLVEKELTTKELVEATSDMLRTDSVYWLVYPESKAHLSTVISFRNWLLNSVKSESSE
jgi:LysR family transcriptional regulator, glycine cleavage system transcriptional activator